MTFIAEPWLGPVTAVMTTAPAEVENEYSEEAFPTEMVCSEDVGWATEGECVALVTSAADGDGGNGTEVVAKATVDVDVDVDGGEEVDVDVGVDVVGASLPCTVMVS